MSVSGRIIFHPFESTVFADRRHLKVSETLRYGFCVRVLMVRARAVSLRRPAGPRRHVVGQRAFVRRRVASVPWSRASLSSFVSPTVYLISNGRLLHRPFVHVFSALYLRRRGRRFPSISNVFPIPFSPMVPAPLGGERNRPCYDPRNLVDLA